MSRGDIRTNTVITNHQTHNLLGEKNNFITLCSDFYDWQPVQQATSETRDCTVFHANSRRATTGVFPALGNNHAEYPHASTQFPQKENGNNRVVHITKINTPRPLARMTSDNSAVVFRVSSHPFAQYTQCNFAD